MMPFFCYYGGKWRIAKSYPEPRHETVVEPFAGAAGYSVRHAVKRATLIDPDEKIIATWQYLIKVSPEEIRALPLWDGTWERTSDLTSIPQEARWLIGWWLNKGMTAPCNIPGKWMRDGWRPKSQWGPEIRERIAGQVDQIRDWTVRLDSYTDVDSAEYGTATWFIDPPYDNRVGRRYTHNRIDYSHLADWCRSLPGQVIVCENDGADWLPFRFLVDAKGTEGPKRTGRSAEVVWTNDERISRMTDEFGAPAPAPRSGNRAQVTEDGIELDQYNRYVLPHPVTGAMQSWTRASTVAKTLDDTYNLNLWKQRNVAHGLARRQDLISLVASFDSPHGNNKQAMNDICRRAAESAGSTARRDLGTALHAFTRNHDAGTPAYLPPIHHQDIAAYAELLRRYGFIATAELAERVVCVPEWGLAGRLDRAVRCPDGLYRIADVKTGDGADEWGDLEFVVQQGIYRRGLMYGTYDPQTKTWQPFPHPELLDPNVAIIIHLPVGQPERAEAYAINIADADELVDHALTVRADRKRKNLRVPWSTYAAFLATRQEVTTTVPDPTRSVDLGPAVATLSPEAAGHDEVGVATGGAIPSDVTILLADAAERVTGELPAGRLPSTFELVRAAMSVPELSALWQVLYPAGHWSVELHEAATARRADIERVAGVAQQPVSP